MAELGFVNYQKHVVLECVAHCCSVFGSDWQFKFSKNIFHHLDWLIGFKWNLRPIQETFSQVEFNLISGQMLQAVLEL